MISYNFCCFVPPCPDEFKEVRGRDGWREASFDLAGSKLKVAVASGLAYIMLHYHRTF